MTIKLLLLAAITGAALFAYRGAPGAASLAARRLAFCILLVGATIAVVYPPLVTRLANLVGVGRGADLVLYGFVLGSIFVWIGLYRRLHDMEHRFVQLNRAIALLSRPPAGATSASVVERQTPDTEVVR